MFTRTDTVTVKFYHCAYGDSLSKGPFTLCLFSDCDYDSSYHNKWVVQDSMEVFTLCDCTASPTPIQPIVSKTKSQFQIAQCERALTGRMGSTPILLVRWTVTISTIAKLDGDGVGTCNTLNHYKLLPVWQ